MKTKTAIITGAAGSLGSELAVKLVGQAWNVVMLDKDRRGLEQVLDSMDEELPGEVVMHPLDLADATPDAFDELLEAANGEFGGIDALVHCAAHFESLVPLEHVLPQDWLVYMQVNLNAAWLLGAMALPYLRESSSGKLIYLLEDLEKLEGALWGPYGISKHALRTLVLQLDQEMAKSPVEVRGVNPGPMSSPIRTRVYHSDNPAEMPTAERAAGRIVDYLEGRANWEVPLIDFT